MNLDSPAPKPALWSTTQIYIILKNVSSCPTPQSLLPTPECTRKTKATRSRYSPSDFTNISRGDLSLLRSNRVADILRLQGLWVVHQACGGLLEQPGRGELCNWQCGRQRVGAREITCVCPSLLCWAPYLLPLHLRNTAGTGEPSGDRRSQFFLGYDKPL